MGITCRKCGKNFKQDLVMKLKHVRSTPECLKFYEDKGLNPKKD